MRASPGGQREVERRPLIGLRVEPDPASSLLDDALADRETDAAAGVLVARVVPAEEVEDVVRERGVDADPVVLHRESDELAVADSGDFDDRGAVALELDRVRDEVLEELQQVELVDAR